MKVLDLIQAGGWMMFPILLCSVVALAIVGERFWTLRESRLSPPDTLSTVRSWLRKGQLNGERLKTLRDGSPLGRIFATGLSNARHGREIMKESIQEEAAGVVHELEKYLSTLSAIATVAPMLGLLGTVLGMIQMFTATMVYGNADASHLAGGISQALLTTAAGLMVAIPAVFFHRFLLRRTEEITVAMERNAVHLVDLVHGDRQTGTDGAKP